METNLNRTYVSDPDPKSIATASVQIGPAGCLRVGMFHSDEGLLLEAISKFEIWDDSGWMW